MTSGKVCLICGLDKDDEVDLGVLYSKEDVTVHYFCMLLSSGLVQNTRISDKKAILGFTLPDIKKEASRGNRLKCSFCKAKGPTIGCCVSSCRKTFHLPCGRAQGTMHQFFGDYRSFCPEHKVQQQLTPRKRGKQVCLICLQGISSWSPSEALTSPCCVGSSFHRRCIQQYSTSAGLHHFKCPKCNNREHFQAEMQGFGVYIPDQDASWEKEPNAYQELYQQHNRCDATSCLCTKGRMHDTDSGPYEIQLCQNCGAFGSHRACKGLMLKHRSLTCPDCYKTLEEYEKKLLRKAKESPYNIKMASRKTVKRLSQPGSPATAHTQVPHGEQQAAESEAPDAKRPRLDPDLITSDPADPDPPVVRDVCGTWSCFVSCLKVDQHLDLRRSGVINVGLLPKAVIDEHETCEKYIKALRQKQECDRYDQPTTSFSSLDDSDDEEIDVVNDDFDELVPSDSRNLKVASRKHNVFVKVVPFDCEKIDIMKVSKNLIDEFDKVLPVDSVSMENNSSNGDDVPHGDSTHTNTRIKNEKDHKSDKKLQIKSKPLIINEKPGESENDSDATIIWTDSPNEKKEKKISKKLEDYYNRRYKKLKLQKKKKRQHGEKGSETLQCSDSTNTQTQKKKKSQNFEKSIDKLLTTDSSSKKKKKKKKCKDSENGNVTFSKSSLSSNAEIPKKRMSPRKKCTDLPNGVNEEKSVEKSENDTDKLQCTSYSISKIQKKFKSQDSDYASENLKGTNSIKKNIENKINRNDSENTSILLCKDTSNVRNENEKTLQNLEKNSDKINMLSSNSETTYRSPKKTRSPRKKKSQDSENDCDKSNFCSNAEIPKKSPNKRMSPRKNCSDFSNLVNEEKNVETSENDPDKLRCTNDTLSKIQKKLKLDSESRSETLQCTNFTKIDIEKKINMNDSENTSILLCKDSANERNENEKKIQNLENNSDKIDRLLPNAEIPNKSPKKKSLSLKKKKMSKKHLSASLNNFKITDFYRKSEGTDCNDNLYNNDIVNALDATLTHKADSLSITVLKDGSNRTVNKESINV